MKCRLIKAIEHDWNGSVKREEKSKSENKKVGEKTVILTANLGVPAIETATLTCLKGIAMIYRSYTQHEPE